MAVKPMKTKLPTLSGMTSMRRQTESMNLSYDVNGADGHGALAEGEAAKDLPLRRPPEALATATAQEWPPFNGSQPGHALSCRLFQLSAQPRLIVGQRAFWPTRSSGALTEMIGVPHTGLRAGPRHLTHFRTFFHHQFISKVSVNSL